MHLCSKIGFSSFLFLWLVFDTRKKILGVQLAIIFIIDYSDD